MKESANYRDILAEICYLTRLGLTLLPRGVMNNHLDLCSCFMPAFRRAALAVAAAGFLLLPATRAAVVPAAVPYQTDFESGAGVEWSSALTDGAAGPFTRFSGRFGNESQILSLTNLVAGQLYTVGFDLCLIDSWDGGSSDWFNVLAGTNQIFHYTFTAAGTSQTYPRPPDVGPVQMGYSASYLDAIYRWIEVSFTRLEHGDDDHVPGAGA